MLKAIETIYNGYRFRSRLEARWAVFFDSLGIEYQYEPEGYDLDGIYYLPDFYLPKQDCFIEIKGLGPNGEEDKKAWLLSKASGKNVFIFWGECSYSIQGTNDGAYVYYPGEGWDNYQAWCECPFCNCLGIKFDGRADRLPCGCAKKSDPTADRGHNALSPRLTRAYIAAKQARFEHGETPLVRR